MPVRLESFMEAFFCHIPVYDTEPVVNVSGPYIVVLQIIRMLPHIYVQYRYLSPYQRSILVGCGSYPEFISVKHEPCIARSENGQGSLLELRLKIIKGAELPIYHMRETAFGDLIARRSHSIEKETVVVNAARVVPNRDLQRLRQTGPAAQKSLKRHVLKHWIFFYNRI